ncbi:MAG: exonuclease, partial [Flavobacteriaceae bacterium]
LLRFGSMAAAENFVRHINEEFQLCLKLTGLSQSKHACSWHAEGLCLGGCINKEPVQTYNERALKALARYSLNKRNMVIIDKGREIGEHSAILIKNGIFQGLGFYDLNHQINNIHILESIITPMKGGHYPRELIEIYIRKKKHLKILELH